MAEQSNGGKQLILSFVLVAVLGALAGTGAAYFMSGSMVPQSNVAVGESAKDGDAKASDIDAHAAGHPSDASGESEGDSGDHGGGTTSDVVLLPPIITNLASPRDVWMRLEAAILLKEGSLSGEETTNIATDIMGFLRTLSVDQIEGASAFQHLREDLLEHVNIRLEGRAAEFLIFGMVVE